MPVAIQVEGLSKRYRIGELQAAYGTLRESLSHAAKRFTGQEHRRGYEEIWALRDVSFTLDEGKALGVIGRNGAGKSTLLKVLTRITTPTSGRAEIRGRVGSLLEVGTGFHPELTGRENVFLNGAILGMKRREIQAKLPDIAEFSGVEKFLDTPVKRYSSGMHVRLAFSVAAHFEPEIMLVDEVLSVGDAEFQARCLGRMEDIGATGRTVVFVSHQLQAVAQLCDRAILLEEGQIVNDGPSADVVADYLQTVTGTSSSQSWTDEDGAPGDDLVRLHSVRVTRADGETADSVDVREPVGVELAFSVLRDGPPILPKIKVVAGGHIAFNAMDVDPRWHDPSPPGEYVTTAWIPGNFLNEGLVTIDAAVCSLDSPKLHHHVSVHEAVSFHVYDPLEGDSSRGTFTGQWRGVVRPLLDWTVGEV
ncbi:MAG: polysaccharide ABC transporter ATP-binding protein [Gaiellaceae bacterium]